MEYHKSPVKHPMIQEDGLTVEDLLHLYFDITTGNDYPDGDEWFTIEYLIPLNSKPFSTDRKSTRLNSSHRTMSYAVFCLKKRKKHGDAGLHPLAVRHNLEPLGNPRGVPPGVRLPPPLTVEGIA